MRTFQRCEQYLYEPGSGSGIYYAERTDGGFSSAGDGHCDSNQADALRNPKIVVDRETGFLFVIAGKANLIEYPCAYRPTAAMTAWTTFQTGYARSSTLATNGFHI